MTQNTENKKDDSVLEEENCMLTLVRAESMHMTNDPRFFAKNVIDQRVKAFTSLTFIGTLMIANSLGQCFSLKKDIDLTRVGGVMQLIGFAMMSTVLFLDTISVLVLAHQLFYAYRLLTAGPSGFEITAAFYLNENMIIYRHFAVKCLLLSLPLFVLSSGFSLYKKFDEVGQPPDEPDPKVSRILAVVVFSVFMTAALIVLCIRWSHKRVFRQLYLEIHELEHPLMSQVHELQTSSHARDSFVDT